MELISKLLLFISIIIIIICIFLGIQPDTLKVFNESLQNSYNIFAYLAMLFAAIAILIACLAFEISVKKPKLKLSIWPWQGQINKLELNVNINTKKVSITKPNTSFHFKLENNGQSSAKYPLVEIVFKNAYFPDKESFPGWQAVYHANAYGYYGFRWSPKENIIIYPGLPQQLPPMYFSSKYIDNPFDIKITIVADGFSKKTYELPVKINYIDFI